MCRYLASFLLVTALSLPVVVSAQSDADVAAVVMRRAQEAYDAGDFERAAVLLEESVELFEAPAIHYNLARTYSELSRWQDARLHYRRFLELSPQTDRRDGVEARVAELERRIEREEASAQPLVSTDVVQVETGPTTETETETSQETTPQDGPPLNGAPLVLFGTGAAVALASIPFGVASGNAEERAAQAATHREGAGEIDTAQRHANVSNALWIAGGVLAVVGLIWVLAKPRRSEAQASFDGTLRVRF